MQQSWARLWILIALICSSLSVIFTSISYSIPRWKSISLPSNFSLVHQLDPLIRSELDKYLRHLYQPGERHSIGLAEHCLSTGLCGDNALPTFDLADFGRCQNIRYHRHCLFSRQPAIDADEQCRCEKPLYIRLIRTLMIFLLDLSRNISLHQRRSSRSTEVSTRLSRRYSTSIGRTDFVPFFVHLHLRHHHPNESPSDRRTVGILSDDVSILFAFANQFVYARHSDHHRTSGSDVPISFRFLLHRDVFRSAIFSHLVRLRVNGGNQDRSSPSHSPGRGEKRRLLSKSIDVTRTFSSPNESLIFLPPFFCLFDCEEEENE